MVLTLNLENREHVNGNGFRHEANYFICIGSGEAQGRNAEICDAISVKGFRIIICVR